MDPLLFSICNRKIANNLNKFYDIYFYNIVEINVKLDCIGINLTINFSRTAVGI